MRYALIGAVLLATASIANAQLIVGNDQTGEASIWNVDPESGAATALYTASDSSAKPWGMAYDSGTNTLYWNNGSTLFSSPYGATLTPTNLGTITIGGATSSVVSLAFNAGKLYATKNITTEAVYEINTNTLEATQVYAYNSSYDFGGLDFDPVDGSLYGLSDSAPAGQTRGLYKIDLDLGTETFVAGYPAGETDIDGLAVFNGIAYFVTDGPNSSQPFYSVDINSGNVLGTIPSPFTGSGTFSAATWVPEPTSLAALALLGVLGLRRR